VICELLLSAAKRAREFIGEFRVPQDVSQASMQVMEGIPVLASLEKAIAMHEHESLTRSCVPTKEWLIEKGFMPDGENGVDLGLALFGDEEYEHHENQPAFQLLVSTIDFSLWLEAYSIKGESLAILCVQEEATCGCIIDLMKQLGAA
jgi:hypothetical protein